MNQFHKNILKETLDTCAIHDKRMMFAYRKTIDLFPMDLKTYDALSPEEISFIDQLIFRFSKLQDLMGNKLFRIILRIISTLVLPIQKISVI